MGKASRKNESVKLPKRLLGVKVPKKTRKNLNRLLSHVSRREVEPLAAAALGALATFVLEHVEKPLGQMEPSGKLNAKTESEKEHDATAH